MFQTLNSIRKNINPQMEIEKVNALPAIYQNNVEQPSIPYLIEIRDSYLVHISVSPTVLSRCCHTIRINHFALLTHWRKLLLTCFSLSQIIEPMR